MILNSLSLIADIVVQGAINQVLGTNFLCVVQRNPTRLIRVLVVKTQNILTARAQVFLLVRVGSLDRALNLSLAHKAIVLLIFTHLTIGLPLVAIQRPTVITSVSKRIHFTDNFLSDSLLLFVWTHTCGCNWRHDFCKVYLLCLDTCLSNVTSDLYCTSVIFHFLTRTSDVMLALKFIV